MTTTRKTPPRLSIPHRVRCGTCGIDRELCSRTRKRLARLKQAYVCKPCRTAAQPIRVERDGLPHKWCGRCKAHLPADRFAALASAPDGLQYRCRACMRTSGLGTCACGATKSAGRLSCLSCWRGPRKVCEACGRDKPLNLYIQQRGTSDGYMASCRHCVNRKLVSPNNQHRLDSRESLKGKSRSVSRDRCHYERYFST